MESSLFLHRRTETIVSALRPEEVIHAFEKVVERTQPEKNYHRFSEEFLYTGLVWQNGFSLKSSKEGSDFFDPRITGRIERTGTGSIIFLCFRMTPLTGFFVWFFTFFSFLILIFFIACNKMVFIGIIAFASGIMNYFLAIKNFTGRIKRARGEILWVLNLRKKMII